MFEVAFSLRGRLGRLHFFLGELALGAAFLVGLGAIFFGGLVAATKHDWALVVFAVLAVLPLLVAMLWCSLSLHVRRIRDIGWDPVIVIASWILARVADKLILTHLLPQLATRDVGHGTYLGIALDVTLSLLLLFWPGHDRAQADDDDRYLQPGPPRWVESPRPAAAVPLVAPAPRVARPGAPVQFGRRGLR